MVNGLLPAGPATEHELESLGGELRAAGLPISASSPGLTSSIIAKSGGGTLFGFTVYSDRASSQFILLFDSTGVPSNGAVPAAVFDIATVTTRGVYYGSVGRWHNQGIVLCNSSTKATLTIGSADCFFDVQYV